jgi:hypothetical protein
MDSREFLTREYLEIGDKYNIGYITIVECLLLELIVVWF